MDCRNNVGNNPTRVEIESRCGADFLALRARPIASIGISDSQVVAHQDVMIGLVIMLPTSAAFHPSAALPLRHSLLPQLAITSCISDDDDKPLPLETSSDLFASLRCGNRALDKNLEARWKKAECKSQVGLVLENWIRRISLDWPRCAVGSAEGSVYVADLTSGEVLTKASVSTLHVFLGQQPSVICRCCMAITTAEA